MSRTSRRAMGIEPLGRVLARDSGLRVPDSIETTPVSVGSPGTELEFAL